MDESGRGPTLSRRAALGRIGGSGAALLIPSFAAWRPSAPSLGGRAPEVFAAAISDSTLRLTVLASQPGSEPVPLYGALVPDDWSPDARFDAPRAGPHRVGDFEVAVDAEPLRIRILRAGDTRVHELTIDSDSGALTFPLGNGPLLGMGQGGPQFDRRGSTYRMRSGQGGYRLRTHGGRVPIQWLVSTDGWAFWIHHPLGTFDLTGEHGRFEPPADSPLPLDLFFVDSGDPTRIMGEWARLTGLPEMPPLWAFGYHQSHRTLAGPDEILGVARTFREKRLPCDSLIYLGTGFTPSGWNTVNGSFDWNPDNFPDPEGMIRELHAMNFRVSLHVVLEGRRLTGSVSDPCPDPPADTGSGQRWPDEQRVACYWPTHRHVLQQGIDGWWPDQGDGFDAASRLARIRMYRDGTRALRPGQRPFALHRNGAAGMARYAPFLWSGDVYSTWETLRTHVAVAINTGLSGIPYWGTDIGGFVPTPEYTGELHIRWFQFGAFCPLFRAHGRTWHLRLPWGWNTGELGPDEVANYRGGAANPARTELHNPDVESICREYLELRYRLMPYLYTAVRETCDTGLPIIRALWLHYPDDASAAACGDAFLWGPDFLVAPVTEPGATHRTLYLPDDTWYDFRTETALQGGREITRPVDLHTTPLYVRAGAVIPIGPVRQFTAETVDEPLTLLVFPGADRRSRLYDDDGLTFAFQNGDATHVLMDWADDQHALTLQLADGSTLRTPDPRPLTLRVAGSDRTRRILFDGTAVRIALD